MTGCRGRTTREPDCCAASECWRAGGPGGADVLTVRAPDLVSRLALVRARVVGPVGGPERFPTLAAPPAGPQCSLAGPVGGGDRENPTDPPVPAPRPPTARSVGSSRAGGARSHSWSDNQEFEHLYDRVSPYPPPPTARQALPTTPATTSTNQSRNTVADRSRGTSRPSVRTHLTCALPLPGARPYPSLHEPTGHRQSGR